jgi:hypothetical protein
MVLLCRTPVKGIRQIRGSHGTTGRSRGPDLPSGCSSHRRPDDPRCGHADGALGPQSVGTRQLHLAVHLFVHPFRFPQPFGNPRRHPERCSFCYAFCCAFVGSRCPGRRRDRSSRRRPAAGRRPEQHAEHRTAIPLVDGPAPRFARHRPGVGLAAQARAHGGREPGWGYRCLLTGAAGGVPAPRPAGLGPGQEAAVSRASFVAPLRWPGPPALL